MRALDTRKVLQEVKRQCRRNGIEFLHDPGRGKGSHQSIVFRDPAGGAHVRVVIPGHRELSPGVQRNVLQYLAGLVAQRPLAGLAHQILEQIFRD
jgi:hypothetical protein